MPHLTFSHQSILLSKSTELHDCLGRHGRGNRRCGVQLPEGIVHVDVLFQVDLVCHSDLLLLLDLHLLVCLFVHLPLELVMLPLLSLLLGRLDGMDADGNAAAFAIAEE